MMNRTSDNQTEPCGGVPFGTGPGIFHVVKRTVQAFCVDGGRIGHIPVRFPTVEQAVEACLQLRGAIEQPATNAAVTLKSKMSAGNLRAFLADELGEEVAELAAKRFRRLVGALRRRKEADPYRDLLLALHDAVRAGERAESRPASNWQSRIARQRDRLRRFRHLRAACELAKAAAIRVEFHNKRADREMSFELPGGPVSFVTIPTIPRSAACPGRWADTDECAGAVLAALREYIERTRPTR
jgi:hypothetical protein